MIFDTLVNFGRELAELGEDPVRTRQGIVAACSVMLATFLALLLEVRIAVVGGHQRLHVADVDRRRLAAPWHAATHPERRPARCSASSWRDGCPTTISRSTCSSAAITMLGVIAMQVSPHGLAWLFLCITSILVLLESLTNPLQAASVAYYRLFEVGIGVLSAIIVANLLQDWHREPPPHGAGLAPSAGRAMARRPARRPLGDRRLSRCWRSGWRSKCRRWSRWPSPLPW